MTEPSLYERKADILKALAHPVRLCIIEGLMDRQCNVNYMRDCLHISQANTSQHLAKLKSAGIVKGTRNGNEITYEVTDKLAARIVKMLCDDQGDRK
jgi:ArsR family transcriptional regulator